MTCLHTAPRSICRSVAGWLRAQDWRLWALLAFAALLRFSANDWDAVQFFHPDERRIATAVREVSFRPLQLNPHFFAYGSLPIYLVRIASSLLSVFDQDWSSYGSIIRIGRWISGTFAVLTVLLLVRLGETIYSRPVGLLAGFLLAACVLHIQNAHFMTVDILLTFLVLLALYFLILAVQYRALRHYILAGATIGIAVSTKFSALPLLGSLGVAALLGRSQRRSSGILASALAVASIAFTVSQPYAWLDFGTYSHEISEQGKMVRNAGLVPYTNQYISTIPYAYELEQLVVWGMAPLLGVVAVWATVRSVMCTARKKCPANLVLCAWIVPYFLITGWFEVKFVRYLLPIYPIMILWAAAWLWRVACAQAWGRALLWTVAAGSLLAAMAFSAIYTREHTAVSASRWVYRHIPADNTILGSHWEEGFPLVVGANAPSQFRIIEFPYYEPDTPTKVQLLSQSLASADYIVFPTKRIYGAVTQAAGKFPLTSHYVYLLFAGDLGYTLAYEQASRPGLFGIELPDELADESLSVYDHPKVLIFRNTARLDAYSIADRILFGVASRKLSRSDVLLAGVDETGKPKINAAVSAGGSSALDLLQFGLLIQSFSLAAYPFLRRWLAGPGCYALAKVLGLLGFAYPVWLLVSIGVIHFSHDALLAVSCAWLVAGLYGIKSLRCTERREIALTEAVFWAVFSLFLLARAFNPEIYWGEKPMDFAILNALYRTDTLPPPEPWFAGSALHYSYFGHFVIAAIGKACNISPGAIFNLGIAFVAALTAVAAFAAGCALGGRQRTGVLSAVFVTLIGNLSALRELIHHHSLNFDYFWATSRVIAGTINEYPVWSLLFADLHAHVLVMPWSLSVLALMIWWVRRPGGAVPSVRIPLFLLIGLNLGAIPMTSTWGLLSFGTLVPFVLGSTELAHTTRIRRSVLSAAVPLILGIALAAASLNVAVLPAFNVPPSAEVYAGAAVGCIGLALQRLMPSATLTTIGLMVMGAVFFSPHWLAWRSPPSNWSWVRDNFVHFPEYALIFGFFLFVAVSYLFFTCTSSLNGTAGTVLLRNSVGCSRSLGAATAMTLGTALLVFDLAIPVPEASSIRFGTAMLAAVAFYLALCSHRSDRQRLTLLLFSFGLFMTAAVDVITIWDRMNTVFKFYLDAWLIFAVASAAAVTELSRRLTAPSGPRAAWVAGFSALFGASVVTATTAILGLLSAQRVPTPRPSLDGTAYLARRDPYEKAAFDWVNEYIGGIPVIAEAYGPAYSEYARVSMNTGLPDLLGWDYHVYQRGQRRPEIERRMADLRTLYTSESEDDVASLLRRYHVALVYVGELEQRTYGVGSRVRFASWKDLLHPVYQNDRVSIFAVRGQFNGTIPVTTIEKVPEIEPEEAAAMAPLPPGQLREARGVAVDRREHIYVADFGNDRIQEFDEQFGFVAGWGRSGTLISQFRQPADLHIAPEQNAIFVADTWNHRVQRISAQGEYLGEWGSGFFGPRGITVSREGIVYISDTGNHRVRRFTATGEELQSWGRAGAAPGEFKDPIGVTTDAEGRVYVCDNGNGRLQIFDPDGRLLHAFPVDGWKTAPLSEPHGLVAPDGLIWVTVPLAGAVRAYDFDGHLAYEIHGAQESGERVLRRPIGIAMGAHGQALIISDAEGGLFRIALPGGEAHQEPHQGLR